MFGIKTIATGLAVGAILGGGAGLGGVALWNKTPWSAESKLTKTREALVKMTADRDTQRAIAKERGEAITKRDENTKTIAAADAGDATAMAAAWGAQCSAAYNAGASFARSICNAKNPPPAAGQPSAGVMRPSFRADFNRERYTAPADRLPGGGER
jgi:hypothetical protein